MLTYIRKLKNIKIMKKVYSLYADKATKTLTAVYFIICIFATFMIYSISFFLGTLFACFLALVTILVYLFTPLKVITEENGIRVKKVAGSVFIPYREIRDIATTKFVAFRLFGSGGLFGFYGIFHFKNLGKVKVYSRSRKELVILETKKGKIGLGIKREDFKDFVNAVKERING